MSAHKRINRSANRNALICRLAIAAIVSKDLRSTSMTRRAVTMLMSVTVSMLFPFPFIFNSFFFFMRSSKVSLMIYWWATFRRKEGRRAYATRFQLQQERSAAVPEPHALAYAWARCKKAAAIILREKSGFRRCGSGGTGSSTYRSQVDDSDDGPSDALPAIDMYQTRCRHDCNYQKRYTPKAVSQQLKLVHQWSLSIICERKD